MKITTIRYGKTYSLGNFSSERIDLEATLDDGETPEQALLHLKEKCDNFHQGTNKLLFVTNQITRYADVASQWAAAMENPSLNTEYIEPPPKKTKDQMLLEEIQKATSISDLNQWKLLISNAKEEIKDAYNKKFLELTK